MIEAEMIAGLRDKRGIRQVGRNEDELIALIAHELRNPLAAIVSALELLRHEGDDAATRAQVESTMDRQTRQMACLIEDLLDVSRVRYGKAEHQTQLLDMAEVMNLAIETVRPTLDQRGHMLDVTVQPERMMIQGDRTRLAQVVTNLLVNAAKYTDPGGRIELAAQTEGDDVVIRVRDNGVGISPELRPHVFEPFAQASHSVGRSRGGLGIGLALVRQIVAAHGGTVSASSAGEGQGSEFVVRLPQRTPTQTPDDTMSVDAPAVAMD
jgi:signal transduction histidine kinase